MKNKSSLILITLGTTLILLALFLCIYNIFEDKKSGEKAHEILIQLKDEIESTSQTQEETDSFYAQFSTPEKKAVEKVIDGEEYIGYITLPELKLELPVMDDWDYSKLEISPCRYSGSAKEKNLVIIAHNYSSHFRRITSLNSDDIIYFTDTNGKQYEYKVVNTELVSGTDFDAMLSDTDNSWDITLFTCTLDGRNRVTVRGVEKTGE